MAKPKKRKSRKKAVPLTPEQVAKGEQVARGLLREARPFVKPGG